jgi:hypothetical protein
MCPCAFDTLEQGAQITGSNVEANFDLNQKSKHERLEIKRNLT